MINKFHFGILMTLVVLLTAAFFGGVWIDSSHAAVSGMPDLEHAQWLILGPFPNISKLGADCPGFSKDFLASAGGEAAVRPKAGSKVGKLIWSSLIPDRGIINFQRAFGSVENSVAYAYTEFVSPAAQPAAFKIGSDDGNKIWLNGDIIWENHIHRSYLRDNDAVLVNLAAGTNRLLVKIDQGNGGWEFGVCLVSPSPEKISWGKVPQPAFRFVLSQTNILKTGFIAGRAATVPSFAVQEGVTVIAEDASGHIVAQQNTETGQLVKLCLPPHYSGSCTIRVAGKGVQASRSSDSTIVLVGDHQKIIRSTAARARKMAFRLQDTRRSEDPAPTLLFLADQLEGKLHSSLSNTERTIRAIETIDQICNQIEARLGKAGLKAMHDAKSPRIVLNEKTWPGGIFPGVRQWAYRSPIDGSAQPYTLYLPASYSPSKKYRLLVCLHGYSGDDYGAAVQAVGGAFPQDFIVVAPFGRGDLAYRSVGEQDVLDVMDLIERSYPIDPNRVYLTGWSMGGCGVWRIGQFYADRFAAIAPFCGWSGLDYLENLQNTPVLIVHGDNDSTVPVTTDQAAFDRLTDLKYRVRYDELPGVGHDAWGAWTRGYGAERLYEYLRKFEKNPWPEKVTCATAHMRYGKEYWLRILELLHPLIRGCVSAAIRDDRHLQITTDNVKTFALNLKHPKLAQNGRVLLEIDGYGLPVDAGQASCLIDYSRENNRFISRKMIPDKVGSGIVRHDGGGIADLFTGPLTIVYGKEFGVANQKKFAEIMANWRSTPQVFAGTKVGRFTVKKDTEVSAADIRRTNLLLLGNNQVASRLISQWGGKNHIDYLNGSVSIGRKRFDNTGLIMVYPNPEAPSRLVGVIILPFAESQTAQFLNSLRLALSMYGLRGDDTASFILPDVMVLSSPSRVQWQGEFDYQWRNLRAIDYNKK